MISTCGACSDGFTDCSAATAKQPVLPEPVKAFTTTPGLERCVTRGNTPACTRLGAGHPLALHAAMSSGELRRTRQSIHMCVGGLPGLGCSWHACQQRLAAALTRGVMTTGCHALDHWHAESLRPAESSPGCRRRLIGQPTGCAGLWEMLPPMQRHLWRAHTEMSGKCLKARADLNWQYGGKLAEAQERYN